MASGGKSVESEMCFFTGGMAFEHIPWSPANLDVFVNLHMQIPWQAALSKPPLVLCAWALFCVQALSSSCPLLVLLLSLSWPRP